jgi:predicted exporter
MRLPFNFSFINKHKKIYLASIVVIFAAFALLFSQVKFKEDVSEMLPQALKEEMRLFKSSPLSNKIFIVVESPDEEQTRKAAEIISYEFIENGALGLSFSKTDEDFILPYYYRAPYLWNKDFAGEVENLITSKAVQEKMEENYKNLLSPAGAFVKDFIIADPLGMLPVFAKELKSLDLSNTLEAKNGYISSHDGKKILLICDYPQNSLDSAHAKKINAVFSAIKKELPADSNAFLMGAVRYTNENNEIILKDIRRILFVSSFCMLALFFVFLRTKKALLIYLVPPAAMSAAAVTVYFLFGGISGITVGFGSVLMGLSVDYSAYMYFAMKASGKKELFVNIKKMFKPITVSAVTSIVAFSLLFFSSIPLFKQIAVFTVTGLAAALFLALFAAPFVFECEENAEKSLGRIKTFLSPAAAAAVIALIFGSAAVSFKFINFNASLDSVNTVSKRFETDRAEFEKLTASAYNNNAFFFVFGNTVEETLKNNEVISSKNENTLKLAKLYPSQKTSSANLDAWKKFWNSAKIESVKMEIDSFAKKKGLKPGIFAPFYEFLKTGKSPHEREFSLNDIYNPLIKNDNGFAFVNIVPKDAVIAQAEGITTLLISNESLQEKITSGITNDVIAIMCVLVICTFFVLILWLKKVQFALAALLAPLCGVCVFLTAAAVFGVEVNLFGLFAAPLLIGLGIDYGVFIIYQQKGETELHPTKAVLVAAFSTIIGFGSLMIAGHKVLFIIGFMVFTGILTAITVSVFVLPSLLKGIKKGLLLLLVCLLPFAGCASAGGVKYNVKEPSLSDTDNADTAVFYGSYMDDLSFRAISRAERDGYRIVVMNDLGVKLQDMKIKKEEDTDVYFYIEYMPKDAIENFAGFFKEYYFCEEKPNIRQEISTIYYFKNKEAIIWVKKI